jgi:hypothetical protein
VKYAQCVKLWSFDILVLFLKCVVSEVLCSVSNGKYIEYGKCSTSNEEKGRRAHITHVPHLRKREMHAIGARLPFIQKYKKIFNRIFTT